MTREFKVCAFCISSGPCGPCSDHPLGLLSAQSPTPIPHSSEALGSLLGILIFSLLCWWFSARVRHHQSGDHNGLQSPVRYVFKFHSRLSMPGWPWASCLIILSPVIFPEEGVNTCPAGLICG